MATIKGKTGTGFEFEIDREVLEDAEFLEAYRKQEHNGMELFDFIKIAIGEEQKSKLYDHVRNEKGRVPMSKLKEELGDILLSLAENPETKN